MTLTRGDRVQLTAAARRKHPGARTPGTVRGLSRDGLRAWVMPDGGSALQEWKLADLERLPADPQTPEEWQQAVDAAQALLLIDDARLYGLAVGGPGVDRVRCRRVLAAGHARGVSPSAGCVERMLAELSGAVANAETTEAGR